MAPLLRRLPSGKNASEAAAEEDAPKRTSRFSFLLVSRSCERTDGLQEKKKRKTLRCWKASLTRLLTSGNWEQILWAKEQLFITLFDLMLPLISSAVVQWTVVPPNQLNKLAIAQVARLCMWQLGGVV
jgi:hypothetical protein